MRRVCLVALCGLVLASGGILLVGSLHPADCVPLESPSEESQDLLTLEVTKVPLETVVQILMRDSGMNIILAGTDKMETPITANLKRLPLETILKTVVASAGIAYTRTADGTYIIGTDVDPTVAATPDQGLPAPKEIVTPNVPEPLTVAVPEPPRRTRTERISLRYLNPKQAMTLVGAVPADVALDENARPKAWWGGNLNVFDGMWGPKVDLFMLDNPGFKVQENTTPSNVTITVPAAPTTDTGPLNPAIAERSAEPRDQFNQVTGPRPRPTNQPGQPGSPGTSNQGTTTGSDDIRPDGIDAIIPFEPDNSLIVKGEDDAIQELKDLITLVDIPPKQVLIKAEYVEVSTTLTQRLGVDWLLSRPNYLIQTDFRPSGNVIAYVQSGNLTANLRAELTTSGGKVVNAPIIHTLNNTAATISSGRQIPFYTSVTQFSGTGNPVTATTVVYVDATSELSVLPQINGDNSITLIMQPRLSDSSSFVRGPNGEEAPIISQQQLSTAARVPNGQTIVVGGFVKKNDSNGQSRVPILSDLPLIGKLFQSGFQVKQDTETLVFITPTVIEETSGGTALGIGVGPTP